MAPVLLFPRADELFNHLELLDKGKPSERVARKVTGLSLERDKAAELPGTEIKKIRPAILP